VFYRTAPQQPNSAIRQALGHENSYQQSIQTSQPPVIIHSIDNSNTRLVFGIPSRQPSSDNYESKAYSQNVEENASEYGGEVSQSIIFYFILMFSIHLKEITLMMMRQMKLLQPKKLN
jgi:hypothetical protein